MLAEVYVRELGLRFIYAIFGLIMVFGVSFYYGREIFEIIAGPLVSVVGSNFFLVTSVYEVLWVYVWIAFIISGVVAVFFMVINSYLFLAPGVYAETLERVKRLLMALGFFLVVAYLVLFRLLFSKLVVYGVSLERFMGEGLLDFNLEPKALDYMLLYLEGSALFLLAIALPSVVFTLGWQFLSESKKLGTVLRGALYPLVWLVIVLILPPDLFIHLGVFLLIFFCYEFVFICYYVFREYERRLWK